MQNLTTPKAILIGLSLIAAAIASMPFTGSRVMPAHAQNEPMKVQICGDAKLITGSLGIECIQLHNGSRGAALPIWQR
jgi:hypothetical protein